MTDQPHDLDAEYRDDSLDLLNLDQIEAVVTAYLDGHLHVEAYCGPAHAMADAATAMAAELRRLRDRVLTESEYSAAWHAVEGAAGEEGADPGTVLHAVLDRLGIAWAAEETHVVADDSDDPEHVDDCPGCEAFTLTGHRAVRP